MPKFHGYKINTTNIAKIESILLDAKNRIALAKTEEYHRLLSDEVNELTTDVMLNVTPSPDVPILDAAVSRLNSKVQQAEMMNLGTEYDLRSGVTLIPDSGDKCVYIIFNSSNALLEEEFASTKGIEDYTMQMDTGSENTESSRAQKWNALQKRVQDHPVILNAALTSPVSVDPSLLRLDDKETRAIVRARHHVMNRYMQMYSGGREIQPSELMRYTDLALTRLLTPESESEMEIVKTQLMSILKNIEIEDITRDPKISVQMGEPIADKN